MSVRSTWRRSRWLVALALVLALVAAACGSDDDEGGGGDDASQADPNGVARYGINFPNFLFQDAFNPALSTSVDAEYMFFDYIYDTLLDLNKEGTELEPGLAESWKLVDASTLEIKLRPGLKFNNGDPLTTAEVKASVEYAKRESPNDPRRMKTWVNLAEIQVVDAQTMRFKMSTPTAFSLQYELTAVPGMVVHSSMIAGPVAKPIGAGPFQFESYTPLQVVKMSKNPNYYNADEILLGGLDLVNVDLGPASVTALQSDAVDMITTDAVAIEQLRRDPKWGISSMPGNTYYNVYLRLDGPMANVKFRQALSTALDRKGMNEVVQGGLGETTNQPYQTQSPYHNKSVAGAYAYDMTKAKQLLTESGIPAGTELRIVYPGAATNVEQLKQAEIIQQQWTTLGLKITLIPAPDTPAIIQQYYTNKSSNGFSATTVGSANPVTQVSGRFFAGNFVATNQNSVLPDVEALYKQFQTDPSNPKPVQDAVKIMVDNAVEIPIAFRNRNMAYNKEKIGGDVVGPTEVTDNIELDGVFVKK